MTLLEAENSSGYFGVYLVHPGYPKPYQAQVRRGDKMVHLGSFATAEAAALCVARTPEGQAAAQKAAAEPVPLTSEEARQQAQAKRLHCSWSIKQGGLLLGVNIKNPAPRGGGPGRPIPGTGEFAYCGGRRAECTVSSLLYL